MPYVNKISVGENEIDLTGDTLMSADQLAEGIVAHAATGEQIVGTLSAEGGGGSALSKWIYIGQAGVSASDAIDISAIYDQAEEFMVYFAKTSGATPIRIPIHIIKSEVQLGRVFSGGYYYDGQYRACAVVSITEDRSSIKAYSTWCSAYEAGSNVLSSCVIEAYYRTASGVVVTQDASTKALEIS